MKQELSSFDVYAIVRESGRYAGAYIDKFYQPAQDELLIRLRLPGEARCDLHIKLGKFFFFTKNPPTNPERPSTFAMTCRKYLSGGRVESVTQHDFDRVAEIGISRKDGTYRLIIEMFGDGNAIVVGPQGKILQPLRSESWAHRQVRAGREYVPPPERTNPFALNRGDFLARVADAAAQGRDAVRFLALDLNLGGQYAEEVALRAAVERGAQLSSLDPVVRERMFDALSSLLSEFREGKNRPCVVYRIAGEERDGFDALPCRLALYDAPGFLVEENESFLLAQASLFASLAGGCEKGGGGDAAQEAADPRQKRFDDAKGKLERQLAQQDRAVEKFLAAQVEGMRLGELIYAHYSECENILATINSARETRSWDEIKSTIKSGASAGNPLARMISGIREHDGIVAVALDGRTIELDVRRSVNENAEAAYSRAKKMRDKIEGAKRAKEASMQRMRELLKGGLDAFGKAAEKKENVQKHYWFEAYRWFISSGGNVVVAGRDAATNDRVVKKYLTERDRYIHADFNGAPSCIAKGEDHTGRPLGISDATLDEARDFGAAFSRAWGQFGSAQAYWVMPEQVSKTPGSGEFISRGSFIIRGERNYRRCPMEAAIGITELDGRKKVMGGPLSAVASMCGRYVVITPGKEDKNEFANRLARVFGVTVTEVQQALPPGGVRVTGVHGAGMEGAGGSA
ncbi:MAG: hypothetical protein CVT48_00765 [Thermoplasmata archaeon HGW-Thermoplasmata-1]|nr:MAG: hypothetical protein CVT48_00765 [Thermoplasmata archaeon HGW-Thermoplasmata-1]